MCGNSVKYLLKIITFNLLLLIGGTMIILSDYYLKSRYLMVIGWICMIVAFILMLFCLNYNIPEAPEHKPCEAETVIVL